MKLLVPSARLDFRRLRVTLAALLLFAWLGAPACSSSDAGGAKLAQQACRRNSDCDSPFICALGSCTTKCKTSVDCPDGGSCITDGTNPICQSAADKNTPCDKEADCPSPLACASDYRCRNLCNGDSDCNRFDITGRVCAEDVNGVDYCAEPAEVTDGKLTVDPPKGAPDSGVMEPSSGGGGGQSAGGMNSTGGNGGSSGGMSTDAGEGGASGQAGAPTAPAGGTGGGNAGGSGGSGGAAPAVCAPACGVGKQCVEGSCAACGQASGEPCCGSLCSPNLLCADGKCTCGGPSEPCCGGNTCSGGIACVSGTCACGGAGQACCPTSAGSACQGSLACTGARCSCLVAGHEDMLQRSDGSLWWYGSTWAAITKADGADAALFTATKFASLGGTFCGVQSDGSLQCGNFAGTGNVDGELGNGTASGSTIPSPVVTGFNGPALAGITDVFGDPEGTTACAINGAGALWCWGYGVNGNLGNGYTNNSLFAVPVLSASGGPQFTGVASVSISPNHVCAVTKVGALYCWGSNYAGQLGLGTTTTSNYLFPAQVTALFNSVAGVSVGGDGSYASSCATTTDGGVWCWGENSVGELGNGTTDPSNVPVRVVAAASGGAAFSGVVSIQALFRGSGYVAEKGTDGSLWVWGRSGTGIPQPYTEGGFPVTGVFQLTESAYYTKPQFIASDGSFHREGVAVPSPPCP